MSASKSKTDGEAIDSVPELVTPKEGEDAKTTSEIVNTGEDKNTGTQRLINPYSPPTAPGTSGHDFDFLSSERSDDDSDDEDEEDDEEHDVIVNEPPGEKPENLE